MINRLRQQFVSTAAVAVLLVLLSVVGVINGTMRGLIYVQTNRVLDALSAWDSGTWSKNSNSSRPVAGTMLANQFFRLRVGSDGTLIASDLGHISLLEDTDAQEILSLLDLSSTRGRVTLTEDGTPTQFAYRVNLDADSGEYSIILLDVTTAFTMKAQLLRASLCIGGLSFVAFLVILAALSKRAIKPVIANMENQKRFITNAGHELKTPLAIISANTELLEAMNGESEWTRNILSQVQRLSDLIRDLITLSKVSEQEKMELKSVDLSPIAQSAAADFLPVVEQRGKRLSADITPNLAVEGEERFLRELVSIFLDNAAKYCDDGGLIALRLAPESKGKTVVLEVSNDYAAGEGVDYSRFFERFYQQEQSHNNAAADGFGIGLSMAGELVRVMRGKLKVHYSDGRIAFRVTLRAAKQERNP